jgi:uncharacterized membrane protein YfcA
MNILEQIKLLIALKKFLEGVKQMKAGWKSTEFWVTLLGVIGSLVGSIAGMLPPELVVKIVAGLVIVYTIARTITKLTPSTKDDELVAKIGEIINKLGGQVPPDK